MWEYIHGKWATFLNRFYFGYVILFNFVDCPCNVGGWLFFWTWPLLLNMNQCDHILIWMRNEYKKGSKQAWQSAPFSVLGWGYPREKKITTLSSCFLCNQGCSLTFTWLPHQFRPKRLLIHILTHSDTWHWLCPPTKCTLIINLK